MISSGTQTYICGAYEKLLKSLKNHRFSTVSKIKKNMGFISREFP